MLLQADGPSRADRRDPFVPMMATIFVFRFVSMVLAIIVGQAGAEGTNSTKSDRLTCGLGLTVMVVNIGGGLQMIFLGPYPDWLLSPVCSAILMTCIEAIAFCVWIATLVVTLRLRSSDLNKKCVSGM